MMANYLLNLAKVETGFYMAKNTPEKLRMIDEFAKELSNLLKILYLDKKNPKKRYPILNQFKDLLESFEYTKHEAHKLALERGEECIFCETRRKTASRVKKMRKCSPSPCE